eukprot:CAMPEP_0170075728 /NCGR_PEP_ID=MMETSP0019_2-20121128/12822_1 /TAXON_ID=98059 /ORGANISM="Dinobryon sp., Strain UTEXLB2267" /LENGTH=268 /DNA_ID=CAMNT_0010286901 /DNA_START=52 /DNA_END=858 /DNA_ORIENTATION=+
MRCGFREILGMLAAVMSGRQFIFSTFVDFKRPVTSSSIFRGSFNPILISIEGNIGAGKTTLLESLKRNRPQWTFINEPVDSWSKIRNEKGQSILEVFYEDRKRWSYTFQNCALLTRYQEIEGAIQSSKSSGATGNRIFLTERCLDTDFQVFTKMLKAEGSLDSLELMLYEKLLHQLQTTATPLSAIVHVNTRPEVCTQRILKRGREGEDAISLEYLQALDYYQNQWIDNTNVPNVATDLTDVNMILNFIDEMQNSNVGTDAIVSTLLH